jgi:hypothetical protein
MFYEKKISQRVKSHKSNSDPHSPRIYPQSNLLRLLPSLSRLSIGQYIIRSRAGAISWTSMN